MEHFHGVGGVEQRRHAPEHGTKPWATDGTPEGTKMLFDLEPGPASYSPSQFTKAGDLLYFSAKTSRNGWELWAAAPQPH